MILHDDAAYLTLKTHDARFDGRLFVGVTSTGIYCRPVCRVRTAAAPQLPLLRQCRQRRARRLPPLPALPARHEQRPGEPAPLQCRFRAARYRMNPSAVRAAGAAIGRNPLSISVPCHRVPGHDGR